MSEGKVWSVKDASKWFHPRCSGTDAEKLLRKHGREGSFLVRESTSENGKFTLSTRQKGDNYVHVKIRNDGECFNVMDDEFASWSELIDFCLKNPEYLGKANGQPIVIHQPLLNETEPLDDKWYHGALRREIAEDLLRECGKSHCYLVREKWTDPSQLVISMFNGVVEHVEIEKKDGLFMVKAKKNDMKHENLQEFLKLFEDYSMEMEGGAKFNLKHPVLVASVTNIKARTGGGGAKASAAVKKSPSVEFAELQSMENDNLKKSRAEGQRPENKERNRYKNILPYDETRIKLKDADTSVVGSDYINANYISMVKGQKQYIATQGCMAATVSDFWRMIWQENTQTIVMVTDLVEAGKNKCVQYWPKDENPTYYNVPGGHIGVKIEKTDSFPEYKVRKLKLTREGEQRPANRTVYHFHYTAWPDKSLPKKPDGLINFLIETVKHQSSIPEAGPVVVHCSAGIGRTGTFIAIGFIYEKFLGQKVDEINIKEIVRRMREQRSGMVQTEAQYTYLYAVVEYFKRHKEEQSLYANLPGQSDTQLYQNFNGTS